MIWKIKAIAAVANILFLWEYDMGILNVVKFICFEGGLFCLFCLLYLWFGGDWE